MPYSPSPRQTQLLKTLPRTWDQVEKAIAQNGRLKKSFTSLTRKGWAVWDWATDALVRTPLGSRVARL